MTLDTNIIIALLHNESIVAEALSAWKKRGGVLFLPATVEAELLSFTEWSKTEREKVERFLNDGFTFVEVNKSVARTAAEFRRSTSIKLPDAMIAASAIYTGTPLATRNVRDFKHVPGLRVVTF